MPLQMNHSSHSPPNPTIKSLLAFLSAQCSTAVFIALLFTRFWLVSALYAAWWFIDREKPSKGGRRIHVFRNCVVWRYMRDYFPVTVSAPGPSALQCSRDQLCPWSLDTVWGQQSGMGAGSLVLKDNLPSSQITQRHSNKWGLPFLQTACFSHLAFPYLFNLDTFQLLGQSHLCFPCLYSNIPALQVAQNLPSGHKAKF